jgi:hypothetical protein
VILFNIDQWSVSGRPALYWFVDFCSKEKLEAGLCPICSLIARVGICLN